MIERETNLNRVENNLDQIVMRTSKELFFSWILFSKRYNNDVGQKSVKAGGGRGGEIFNILLVKNTKDYRHQFKKKKKRKKES